MERYSALIIVDIQNDFCPGGALPVPHGDSVVPAMNRYIALFSLLKLPIFASRDWHPAKTAHFREFGGIWPVHCVQGSAGADFHSELQLTPDTIVISKGMDSAKDDYSAFSGVDDHGTPLAELLVNLEITDLYIGGLATDYCVKETVIAARREGFTVFFLADASRGVEIQPGDSERAIAEMIAVGATTTLFTHADVQSF